MPCGFRIRRPGSFFINNDSELSKRRAGRNPEQSSSQRRFCAPYFSGFRPASTNPLQTLPRASVSDENPCWELQGHFSVILVPLGGGWQGV